MHITMPCFPPYVMTTEPDKANQQATVICGIAAQKFGIASLHPWQVRIIAASLEGKNTLVIQPTGTGKSLCYTIPPIHDGKTAVVISPTISLMTDQVSKLSNKGIPVTFLGSAQKDMESVMQEVKNGKYRVVYSTPEFFYDKGVPRQLFVDMVNENKVSLLAVDEAHLIVTWESFR